MRTILTAVIALALASGPLLANGPGKGKDKSHDNDRHDVRQHPAAARGKGPGHDNGRHLGWQKQAWKRGERLPLAYLEDGYYVTDYRTYDLAPPPRGYRWVRPDEDRYLLVEIATGLIDRALGY